jgi:ABC-type polysaccharide/polyol phosphate transport system ATPase subunit
MAKIQLSAVHVKYPINEAGYHDSIRRSFLRVISKGKMVQSKSIRKFVNALEDVTMEIEEGERLGLVGLNGSGKTTLLRTITGMCPVTAGIVEVKGSVQAIFNVNAGLDMARTGYENIYVMGLLRGINPKMITQIIPDIEEFTELGDFLDMPVATYSRGMKIRLGLAVLTAVRPDILIIDEGIGAGDAKFLEKAKQRLNRMYDAASVVVLASHSNILLEEMCDRIIWLNKGKVEMDGPASDVLALYQEFSTGIKIKAN